MTRDKYLHFAVSLALTVSISLILNVPLGAISAFVFGVAKEMLDVTSGKHDRKEAWADMLWNFIGIVSGVAIALLLR